MADLQSMADLELDATYLDQADTMALADYVVDAPGSGSYGSAAAAPATLLKTGSSPCAIGTASYWDDSARVPAPDPAATYAQRVVTEASCKPCGDNRFASKPGGRVGGVHEAAR